MPNSPNHSDVIRFGVFEVDLRTGEFRKSGIKFRLQEQPFQVLAALLERPSELVTREDLIQKLWPNGTVVEYEHSVSAAITKLRQALGDSADNPRFVETVPRRGYRFLVPVEGNARPVEARLPQAATPLPEDGISISRYQLIEKIGAGGMDVVYKAEDSHLGRAAALKFLMRGAVGDERHRERFLRWRYFVYRPIRGWVLPHW